MKLLAFGAGGLTVAMQRMESIWDVDVVPLKKRHADVTDYAQVVDAIDEHRPDAVLGAAGLSDRIIGVTLREVVDVNLIGAMNVGQAARAFGTPCVLVASTAGMVPGIHSWYGPAKAGVINFVRAMATGGAYIWAVSPGRMDTPMREADWPDEDVRTRLRPAQVGSVIIDCFSGKYEPGANVVIRKVGLDRVDIYEEVAPCLPSRL